jgi:hypothetical protein
MPLPREKPFDRRPTSTGAFSTTCLHCRVTAGYAFWEAELDELEERHVCSIDNIIASSAQSPLPGPPRKSPQKQPVVHRKYA